MFVAEVRQLLERVRSLLTTCDPATVTGPVAVELVRLFVDLERAGAAGKALFARRVEESGTYAGTGHRDAGDWLSDVAGEPRGHARAVLHTARHLEDLPEVREAFIEGTLSGSQVAEIADAGAVAPSAIPALLETARSGSFASLRREAERARWTTLGQDDAASRDARAHAARHLRSWRSPQGGVCGTFSLGAADWARCAARLEARAQRFFDVARRTGGREGREQYLADALVDLILGARHEPGDSPGSRVLVRVDAPALRRGSIAPGEVCEVAGVGTVSVATARELLGDALFNIVVTDGHDIASVTSTRRTIPARVRVALMQRDPECVVPGCDATLGLQIDHWRTDFALGGPTALDNLARVCKVHHDMHTYGGWRLEGGPGRWAWRKPQGDRRASTWVEGRAPASRAMSDATPRQPAIGTTRADPPREHKVLADSPASPGERPPGGDLPAPPKLTLQGEGPPPGGARPRDPTVPSLVEAQLPEHGGSPQAPAWALRGPDVEAGSAVPVSQCTH